MSGWGGLGGYLEDLNDRRNRAADPTDSAPDNNAFRRACDWAARKGGVVAGAPHVQFGCGPYWDGQPDYDPPEPSTSEPPFEGGQCPGVAYVWESQQLNNSTCQLEPTSNSTPRIGPITRTSSSSGNLQTINGCQGRSYSDVFEADGATFAVNRRGLPDSAPLVRWVRVDGLPDECGNPPPVVTHPDPRPVPGLPPDGSPVPIGDPNDPDDTTPPITFPPTGTPYDPWIPIINPPPGFPPFVFPPSSGDDIPPREGPETDVPPGGTDGDDIPEPEPLLSSEVCIGYAFDFYDIPENRGGIPDTAPTRYYEIFGSAQLKIGTDAGEFYDLPVKIDSRRGVCYRSDESLKVIGLSLNSKLSFGPVRVKPIFVLKENKS